MKLIFTCILLLSSVKLFAAESENQVVDFETMLNKFVLMTSDDSLSNQCKIMRSSLYSSTSLMADSPQESGFEIVASYGGVSKSGQMQFKLFLKSSPERLKQVKVVKYDIHPTFGKSRFSSIKEGPAYETITYSTYAERWSTGEAVVTLKDNRKVRVSPVLISWKRGKYKKLKEYISKLNEPEEVDNEEGNESKPVVSKKEVSLKLKVVYGDKKGSFRLHIDGDDTSLSKVSSVNYCIHPTFRTRPYSKSSTYPEFSTGNYITYALSGWKTCGTKVTLKNKKVINLGKAYIKYRGSKHGISLDGNSGNGGSGSGGGSDNSEGGPSDDSDFSGGSSPSPISSGPATSMERKICTNVCNGDILAKIPNPNPNNYFSFTNYRGYFEGKNINGKKFYKKWGVRNRFHGVCAGFSTISQRFDNLAFFGVGENANNCSCSKRLSNTCASFYRNKIKEVVKSYRNHSNVSSYNVVEFPGCSSLAQMTKHPDLHDDFKEHLYYVQRTEGGVLRNEYIRGDVISKISRRINKNHTPGVGIFWGKRIGHAIYAYDTRIKKGKKVVCVRDSNSYSESVNPNNCRNFLYNDRYGRLRYHMNDYGKDAVIKSTTLTPEYVYDQFAGARRRYCRELSGGGKCQ